MMLAAMKKGDGGEGAKGAKPGGGLLGLGGLGGLTGVGGLKSKMTGMIGNKIDEAAWRSSLTDMHRVRNMARTLWLSLEHTSEAVMRVALEIVTCRKARKILWWNDDSWSMEEGKPEHLRGVIDEKFDAVLQMLGRELKERPAPELKSGPSNREIELEKQLGDLQKRLKISELSLAESKRLMEEQLEEARSRIAQLEHSGASRGETALASEVERLRALEQEQAAAIASMRADLQRKAQLEALLGERSAELERARREAEEAREAVRQKTEELDRLRRDGSGAAGAQLQKEIDELRQNNYKLQDEVGFLKAQLAAAQAAAAAASKAERKEPDAPPPPPPPQASADESAELERLRKLEAEWNSRGETCCTCGKPCLHCTGALPEEPAAAKEKEPKNSSRDDKEVQEMIERKDAEIARLKAEKKELETERMDMLAMIDKLRKQISRLKEVAREAGHGDLVEKLMEQSAIAETMRSPEMSCFSRLYQDAVRRMTEGGRRRSTQRDFVQPRVVVTKQSVFQMAQQFPGVPPPVQQLQQAPAAGRHAAADVAPQGLELRAGRGGSLENARAAGAERHARFELGGIAEAATYSEGGFLLSGAGGAAGGGLPRQGGGHWRLSTTTGSLQRGAPQPQQGSAELLWGFGGHGPEGPAAAPRGMLAAEGLPGGRRGLPTKPLGPGFASAAGLRRSQAAQGMPRTDAAPRLPVPRGAGLPGLPRVGSDPLLQGSRSEPQLRRASGLATPNRLPQLPVGKGSQPTSRSPSRSRQGSKGALPFS
mmetsp:Transcript_32548/g.85344  ORF Transcript_32548/g.85344 Transcript_32548/m.85344 type:complete len:769 (-) Transcript_32548:29-2335(-)